MGKVNTKLILSRPFVAFHRASEVSGGLSSLILKRWLKGRQHTCHCTYSYWASSFHGQ